MWCKFLHPCSALGSACCWAQPGSPSKRNHTFHWRPGPQVSNSHIKNGTFWAQQSRARRWMFKMNIFFFFPSRSGFAICCNMQFPSFCVCLCMQLFSLLLKYTHTYICFNIPPTQAKHQYFMDMLQGKTQQHWRRGCQALLMQALWRGLHDRATQSIWTHIPALFQLYH